MFITLEVRLPFEFALFRVAETPLRNVLSGNNLFTESIGPNISVSKL